MRIRPPGVIVVLVWLGLVMVGLIHLGNLDLGDLIQGIPHSARRHLDRGNEFYRGRDYDAAIAEFTSAIRLAPKYVRAYINRGTAREYRRDYDGAIADYDAAIRLDPKCGPAYTGRAWILATNADPRRRDGKRAIADATRACRLSSWGDGNDLDNLAAAYAEVGDFEQAVRWEAMAIKLTAGMLVPPVNSSPEAGIRAMKGRLALYQGGKPYRNP